MYIPTVEIESQSQEVLCLLNLCLGHFLVPGTKCLTPQLKGQVYSSSQFQRVQSLISQIPGRKVMAEGFGKEGGSACGGQEAERTGRARDKDNPPDHNPVSPISS